MGSDIDGSAVVPRRYSRLAEAGGWGQALAVLAKILKDRRVVQVAVVGLVLGLATLLLLLQMGYGPKDAKAAWAWFEEFMTARPWLLFAAIAILPGLPVPISPVMLLAGAIFHEHPILACLGCLVALELNLVWTYWLAAKPGRGLVQWLFERAKVRVPVVSAGNHMKWLLIVRLTPGLPLFIQSYLLGFIRVPFFTYMWVSLVCSGSIACGVVLTGAGVGEGRIGPVLLGVGLLIVVAVVLRMIGSRLGRPELGV